MTVIQLMSDPVNNPELAADIRRAGHKFSALCAEAGVHSMFRDHYTNPITGEHGIRALIKKILEDAGAVFPKFSGSFREVYVSCGMTTSAIVNQVRRENGFFRYPDKTIIDVLKSVMEKDGEVGSLQLTAAEDVTRACKRPRKVWYLIPAVKPAAPAKVEAEVEAEIAAEMGVMTGDSDGSVGLD